MILFKRILKNGTVREFDSLEKLWTESLFDMDSIVKVEKVSVEIKESWEGKDLEDLLDRQQYEYQITALKTKFTKMAKELKDEGIDPMELL